MVHKQHNLVQLQTAIYQSRNMLLTKFERLEQNLVKFINNFGNQYNIGLFSAKGMRELFCQDDLVSCQDLFLVKFLR